VSGQRGRILGVCLAGVTGDQAVEQVEQLPPLGRREWVEVVALAGREQLRRLASNLAPLAVSSIA
jgi:hypothetical protein